jgi:hypothetical protein
MLTPEQIKSVYGSLEQAAKITGIPVQYQAPTTSSAIPVNMSQDKAFPTYERPAPPDDVSTQIKLDNERKTLEDTYAKQLEDVKSQIAEQQRIADAEKQKQEGVLGQLSQQTTPFREGIETAERKRLKVEENYFANQSLVNELDKLLTESIAMTRKLQTQKVPGLAGLQQSERMIKTQEGVQSRIGVIEAVMSARNNQIGTALTFIDRTKSSIQADRQDRIGYLESLFNFYEQARDEAGRKITELTKDQKDIIKSQISLIEGDYAKTEAAAERIKEMILTNPLMAAESGISLNDSEQEINTKLANWQYTTEIREVKNKMQESGMNEISSSQLNLYPSERVFTYYDSKGGQKHFLMPETTGDDWELKSHEGSLYRVNKKTGKAEVLLYGKSTSTGSGITFKSLSSAEKYELLTWLAKLEEFEPSDLKRLDSKDPEDIEFTNEIIAEYFKQRTKDSGF